MAIIDVRLPKMGESIFEATIIKWRKKIGDTVKKDDILVEIATDKVDSDVVAPATGILIELLYEEQSVAQVNSVIAKIKNDDAVKNIATSSHDSIVNSYLPNTVEQAINKLPNASTSIVDNRLNKTEELNKGNSKLVAYWVDNRLNKTEELNQSSINNNQQFLSPLVIKIAQAEQISFEELKTIQGTGFNGRISKKDILQYVVDKKNNIITAAPENKPKQDINTKVDSPQPVSSSFEPNTTSARSQQEPTDNGYNYQAKVSAPQETTISPRADEIDQTKSLMEQALPSIPGLTGRYEIVEMDRMRKLIAKHMVDSKRIAPHVSSFQEIDVTNIVGWREKNNPIFKRQEGFSLTFTHIFTYLIVRVLKKFPLINASVDGSNIILKKDYHIGIATELPNGNLIVPVIKYADQYSLVGLAQKANDILQAARQYRLKPDDIQGGTFTISNIGSFGSTAGTPIINQPQVAIIALGAIMKKVAVVENAGVDGFAIRNQMIATLSYDHRVVDGGTGGRFLAAISKELEGWRESDL